MGIKFLTYRRKLPWTVTWSHSWTGKRHTKGFASEAEALAFEQARAELAVLEKRIMKKTHNAKASMQKLTVRALLDSYFALSESNQLTLKQAKYHASHIVGAFGHRMAAQLSSHDMLAFVEAHRLRGVAQSTANRRLSILRAALNWAVRAGVLASNHSSTI